VSSFERERKVSKPPLPLLVAPLPDAVIAATGLPQFPTSVRSYETPAARVTGKRSGPGFSFSWNHIVAAYTWDPDAAGWRTDSVLLGLSPKGLRLLNKSLQRESPLDAQLLDEILRETVLGGCKGPPTQLTEMLQRHPRMRRAEELHTVSSPVPIYHASGMSKDVFFFMLVAISSGAAPQCREIEVALKIAKRQSSISPEELSFHRRLNDAPLGSHAVSKILGWYQIDSHPEPDVRGKTVSLEVFHPGPTAGEHFGHSTHLAAACAVSHAAFSVLEASYSSGRSADARFAAEGAGIRIPFPSDINPGNFVLSSPYSAVLVDCGRYHPSHTFSEVLLRLIKVFWEEGKDVGRSGQFLDLSKLFDCVIAHFGVRDGHKLLTEFAITLGFMRGTPFSTLRERYPGQPVDSIGQALARVYAYDQESGTTSRVSTAISSQRIRHRARMAYLVNEPDHYEELLYGRASTIPFHFSDRELRNVSRAVTAYLRQRAAGAIEPGTSRAPRSGVKKVGSAMRPTAKASSLTRVWSTHGGLIERAIYFTPFPDPAVIQLALQTVELCPLYRRGQISSSEDWLSYQRRVLGVAGMLWGMFEDRTFTVSLARITGGSFQQVFAKRAQTLRSPHHKNDSELLALVERWLGVFVTLHHMYNGGHVANLVFIQEHRARMTPLLPELIRTSVANIPATFAKAFPEIYPLEPESYRLSERALHEVTRASEVLVPLLLKHKPPSSVPAMPRFVQLVTAPRMTGEAREVRQSGP
jgi:hypothetical protein